MGEVIRGVLVINQYRIALVTDVDDREKPCIYVSPVHGVIPHVTVVNITDVAGKGQLCVAHVSGIKGVGQTCNNSCTAKQV